MCWGLFLRPLVAFCSKAGIAESSVVSVGTQGLLDIFGSWQRSNLGQELELLRYVPRSQTPATAE